MTKTNFSEKYPNLLTFKGKFKDLKKNGFKFQRLFANNYMEWNFDNGEKYGPHRIWIWRHLGGYVEINDLYSLSKAVAKVLCTPEQLEQYLNTFTLMEETFSYYKFIVDRKTGECIRFNRDLHESIFIFGHRLKEEGIHEEINKWHETFNEQYRVVNFNTKDWIIPKIQELYKLGWFDPFV